jgi:hypothetical protein
MPFGAGKYDKQLSECLKDCGAKQGILIVMDGNLGPSFCAHLSEELLFNVPNILRDTAKQIEAMYKKGHV